MFSEKFQAGFAQLFPAVCSAVLFGLILYEGFVEKKYDFATFSMAVLIYVEVRRKKRP